MLKIIFLPRQARDNIGQGWASFAGRQRSRLFSNKRPQQRHGEPGLEDETFAAIRKMAWISEKVRAEVQTSGRFRSNPAVFIPQRRETGRPIPI